MRRLKIRGLNHNKQEGGRLPGGASPTETPPQELHNSYRGELDVYRVVKRQLLLQVLQLLLVLAAARLHHVLQVEHSRLSAVQEDDRAEIWESAGGEAGRGGIQKGVRCCNRFNTPGFTVPLFLYWDR